MGKLKAIEQEDSPRVFQTLSLPPRSGGRNPLRAKVRHPEQFVKDMTARAAARPPVVLLEEYEIALWGEDGTKVVRTVPGPYANAILERDKAMKTGKYWKCWLGTGTRT